MVIMTNYFNFNFSRRGLLGSALATTAALTVGGPAHAFVAPVRAVRTRPQTLTAAGRPTRRRDARLPRPPPRRQLDRTGDRLAPFGCGTPTAGGTGDR